MKQVALLPAGCQPWNTHVIASGGHRIAYCSTLAIYIYCLKFDNEYSLEKVIAAHEKTITGLCWCPYDPNLIVTCSLEKTIVVWNINSEVAVKRIELNDMPTCVDWSPHDHGILAYGTDKGAIKVFSFPSDVETTIKEEGGSSIRVLRWNPKTPNSIVYGSHEGVIGHINTSMRKRRKLVGGKDAWGPVMDLSWDPLSTDYLLGSFKDGVIVFVDVEGKEEVTIFEKQVGGVKSVCWMPGVPGGFLTADERTGALRIWNVSQKVPTEVLKVKKTGFHAFTFINNSSRGLCTFKDGSVALYDVQKHTLEFTSEVGHTETIFDTAFKPDNPDILATGSFDGSIKIWNIATMRSLDTFPAKNGVIYCLCFSPSKGDSRLAAATSSGRVVVYDISSGKLLNRFGVHKDCVFRVDWNVLEPNFLASSSKDGTVAVINLTECSIHRRYRMTKPCYGCSWSRQVKGLLAAGCGDGRVYVFDTVSSSTSPFLILAGHKRRVFNVAWHPLLPDILASGSDDQTIRVWNVKTKETLTILRGHTSNVRALLWHTEIPWLLLSGSWDGTIRAWNVVSNQCIDCVSHHQVDVYGLSCHPKRPFVFASSSRDSTLRIWSFDKLSIPHKYHLLTERPLKALFGDAAEIFKTTNNRLCGAASREFLARFEKADGPLARMLEMCNFFNAPLDVSNLMRLCQRHAERIGLTGKSQGATPAATPPATTPMAPGASGEGELTKSTVAIEGMEASMSAMDLEALPLDKFTAADYEADTSLLPLIYTADVLVAAEKRAIDLEAVRTSQFGAGIGRMKKDDQLALAADLYLKIGKTQEYCELMCHLNEWPKAIMAAPAVSIDYWKALNERYSKYLVNKNAVKEAVLPLIVSGNVQSLISVFLAQNDHHNACLVAEALASGALRPPPTAGGQPEGEDIALTAAQASATLQEVSRVRARKYYLAGRSFLAAGVYMSIGDVHGAIHTLHKSGETLMAAALASAFKVPRVDYVYQAVAELMMREQLYDLAADWAAKTSNPQRYKEELCCALTGITTKKATMELMLVYPPPKEDVEAKLACGNVVEGVRLAVLAGEVDLAVDAIISHITNTLSQRTPEYSVAVKLVSSLRFFGHTTLVGHSRLAELIPLVLYVGATDAIWRGFTTVAAHMMTDAINRAAKSPTPFPLPLSLLRLQIGSYLHKCG